MRKALLLTVVLVLACASAGDVLWDQLIAAGQGFASQDFEEPYDCYDCIAADDFFVPEPGWTIEEIAWSAALYHDDQVPVYGVHFYIWPARSDGYGDYYGGAVWYEYGMVGGTVIYGDNFCALAVPAVLDPGHYVVGIQPEFDYLDYGQHLFDSTTFEQRGTDFAIINPHACFGSHEDWFEPVYGLDGSFRLSGRVIPEPAIVSLAGLLLGAGTLCLRRRHQNLQISIRALARRRADGMGQYCERGLPSACERR